MCEDANAPLQTVFDVGEFNCFGNMSDNAASMFQTPDTYGPSPNVVAYDYRGKEEEFEIHKLREDMQSYDFEGGCLTGLFGY